MIEAKKSSYPLSQKLRRVFDEAGITNVLHLGTGGCGLCEVCAKRTDEPCRYPKLAMPSLETYGINVSRLAPAVGMKYVNGVNTVTYFGAVLFSLYLAIRPHKRQLLEKHIREGRILVGPWYVQNDFYLTSGEATVRNLIIGTAIAEEFGRCMPVGYAADQFGLISQLPQILSRFGLDSCVFGRGFSKGEPTPLEFYWTAEDGSKVLCEHMAYWYNNAQRFSDDVNGTRNLLQNRYEIMKDRVSTSNYLLMNGVDHLEAQEDLSAIIGAVRPTLPEGQRFFQDTLPEFLNRVKAELAENGTVLEEHGGEFRHGGSDSVLTGTLSFRIDLKLANADCQAQIEHLLEPLCVFCSDLGVKEYPADYMRYLWKLLIENHPHDSICGCSADAVHRHMHDRFARIRENVTDLVSRYAGALLNHVQREGRDVSQFLILVMNTLQQAWDKPITVTLEIPVEEDKGGFVITNAKGETVPFVIRSVSLDRGKRILSPINLPGEREVNVYDIVLDAIGVAGMSYRLAVYPYAGDAVAAGVAQRAVQLAMPILAVSAPVDYNKWIGGRPFVQIAGMPDLFYRPLENAEVEAPLGMSLFEVLPSLPNGVVITAVKGSEDGRGMVVRGYNVTSEAISVTLKSRKHYAHIDRLTLGEKYLASMALNELEVSFSLAPKEIFTVGFF